MEMRATGGTFRALVAAMLMLMALLTAMPPAASAKPGNNGEPGNSGAAYQCQKGGWQALARDEDGLRHIPFASQGECVSYAAQGGTLIAVVQAMRIETTWEPRVGETCTMTWTLHNARPGTLVGFNARFNDRASIGLNVSDANPVVSQSGILATSRLTDSMAYVKATGEPVAIVYPTTACGNLPIVGA
jgi:hypothetical protein